MKKSNEKKGKRDIVSVNYFKFWARMYRVVELFSPPTVF